MSGGEHEVHMISWTIVEYSQGELRTTKLDAVTSDAFNGAFRERADDANMFHARTTDPPCSPRNCLRLSANCENGLDTCLSRSGHVAGSRR